MDSFSPRLFTATTKIDWDGKCSVVFFWTRGCCYYSINVWWAGGWAEKASGTHGKWLPGGWTTALRKGVHVPSIVPGQNTLFGSSGSQTTPDTPPYPAGPAACSPQAWCHWMFDLLKIILVRWISESELGTMVHIQTLGSHGSCNGGKKKHTQTLTRKSGNLSFGSSFARWL